MFCAEQCIQQSTSHVIPYLDRLTLHCNANKIYFHATKQTVSLSQAQKRLFYCLLTGINRKRQIINVVWYENHQRVTDNNYHQLLFQTRALLQRHDLPAQLIITLPNYGLLLNEEMLKTLGPAQEHEQPPGRQADDSLWLRLMYQGRRLFRSAFHSGEEK